MSYSSDVHIKPCIKEVVQYQTRKGQLM